MELVFLSIALLFGSLVITLITHFAIPGNEKK